MRRAARESSPIKSVFDKELHLRRPDKTELAFAMFAFIVLVPMVWFTLRGLFALVG